MAKSAIIALQGDEQVTPMEKEENSKSNHLTSDAVIHDVVAKLDEEQQEMECQQGKFNYVLEIWKLAELPIMPFNAWYLKLGDTEVTGGKPMTETKLYLSEQWDKISTNRPFTISAKTKIIRIRFTSEGPTYAWRKLDGTHRIILDSRVDFLRFSSERPIKSIQTADGTNIELKQL